MKIAICNETYRNWSFEDAFHHAKECGYDGIEIAPFTLNKDATKITAEQCNEVVALAKRLELEVIGLHWLLAFTDGLHLTSEDESTRQRTADYLSHLAFVCRNLGGTVMVFGSPAQRNMANGMTVDRANQLAIECIRQAIPALKENQVVLAIEPLGPEEGNFVTTAKWGRELVSVIDSPFVQLHLDVKAMSTEVASIPEIISASSDCLAHFHCNDPNRRGPGMGDVCFRPIISALQENGYNDWLSVEVFDETVAPETTARESLQYLRKILAHKI